MKTVYFASHDFGYQCSLPGDQEGEYVRVEVVQGMVEAAEKVCVAMSWVGICQVEDTKSALSSLFHACSDLSTALEEIES